MLNFILKIYVYLFILYLKYFRNIWTKIKKMEKNEYKSSILVIEHADILDSGKFTCQVSDHSHQQCQSIALTVLPLPEVIMKPSVTVKPVSFILMALFFVYLTIKMIKIYFLIYLCFNAGRQRDHYVFFEKRVHQIWQFVVGRRHAFGENGQKRVLGGLASRRQRVVREEHNGENRHCF